MRATTGTLADRFLSLSAGQRRVVHELLAEHALGRWRAHAESRGEIRYPETVCGTVQAVDADLPGDALESVRSGQGIAAVAERYSEPLAAMQDGDLCFPDSIQFAYYAIYNFFRRYGKQDDVDDWLLVNQAISSEENVERGTAVLAGALEKAI